VGERGRRICLAGLVATAWAGCVSAGKTATAPATAPATIRYVRGRKIAELANRRIRESSGLACSRRHEGVFWTHNDSGDRPRIYALNRKGEHLATVGITAAAARDWEDMASFQLGGKAYLLLADVGDNSRRRSRVSLYIVAEPTVGTKARPAVGTAAARMKIDLTYDDGPHDCEAVAVDPGRRKIYLVSKVMGACKVYELPLPKRSPAKPVKAKAIATLSVPFVTGMDISPDGRRMIVVTYGPAYEFTRRHGETWADALKRRGRAIVVPRRRQGESICYGPDGRSLYLTSEKLPTPLLEVPAADDPRSPATAPR